MALPSSYSVKSGAFKAYFEAIQGAEAPDRFSVKFLEGLEFTSTNDRTFIAILKELGFLDANNVPTKRYYQFLDKENSSTVLAEAIREMFSDLFAIKKDANKLTQTDVYNKLRTLYSGKKSDVIIKRIAANFVDLCKLADFETSRGESAKSEIENEKKETNFNNDKESKLKDVGQSDLPSKKIEFDALQYHINIVLPETKDQSVYDAIFKSLRDHLG